MAATHSARSMSLASFRAGHALRVDAERAERGGREPAAQNPGHHIPSTPSRDRSCRPPAHTEGFDKGRRQPPSVCAPSMGDCLGVEVPGGKRWRQPRAGSTGGKPLTTSDSCWCGPDTYAAWPSASAGSGSCGRWRTRDSTNAKCSRPCPTSMKTWSPTGPDC